MQWLLCKIYLEILSSKLRTQQNVPFKILKELVNINNLLTMRCLLWTKNWLEKLWKKDTDRKSYNKQLNFAVNSNFDWLSCHLSEKVTKHSKIALVEDNIVFYLFNKHLNLSKKSKIPHKKTTWKLKRMILKPIY